LWGLYIEKQCFFLAAYPQQLRDIQNNIERCGGKLEAGFTAGPED
jgi:hypothetical protein